jgi:RNA polymerase sigma-70 factor (ECF subfamily)
VRREAVDTAVVRFVELPTVQRSVVILKDVLDQSLEEFAALARPHGQRGEGPLRSRAGAAIARASALRKMRPPIDTLCGLTDICAPCQAT